MSIIRSAPADRRRRFTSHLFLQFQSISWLFPPYEQHMFVHDKSSLCFLRLTDLSIHKQHKTQASWVSATDSYGGKSLAAFHTTAVTSCASNLFFKQWHKRMWCWSFKSHSTYLSIKSVFMYFTTLQLHLILITWGPFERIAPPSTVSVNLTHFTCGLQVWKMVTLETKWFLMVSHLILHINS